MGRRQLDHPSRIGKHWSCTFCAKVFISYDQLKVHMNVHTKERPFECDQCPANYSFYSAMHGHKKRRHRRNEPVTVTTRNPTIRQASPVESSLTTQESQNNSHVDSTEAPVASPSNMVTDLENLVELIALSKCEVVLPRLEKSWTGSKEEAEAEVIGEDNMMEMESKVNVIPLGSVDISKCPSIEKEEKEEEIEEPEKPEVEKIFSCELCSCWFFKERKLVSHVYSAHRITAMLLKRRMM